MPARQREAHSAREDKVAAALRETATGLDLRTRAAVVLPENADYHGLFSLAPDLVPPVVRVAVELDGGNGRCAQYSPP